MQCLTMCIIPTQYVASAHIHCCDVVVFRNADPGSRNEASLSHEAALSAPALPTSLEVVGADIVSKFRSENPDGLNRAGDFVGPAAGLRIAWTTLSEFLVELHLPRTTSGELFDFLSSSSAKSINSSMSNNLVIIAGNLHANAAPFRL